MAISQAKKLTKNRHPTQPGVVLKWRRTFEVAERMRREHVDVVRLTIVGLVALIAIIPAAMALSSSGVAPLVCLALAAMGVVALIGSAIAGHSEATTLGVQGRVVQDGFGERWVQLRGVHPAFSRALAARFGR